MLKPSKKAMEIRDRKFYDTCIEVNDSNVEAVRHSAYVWSIHC